MGSLGGLQKKRQRENAGKNENISGKQLKITFFLSFLAQQRYHIFEKKISYFLSKLFMFLTFTSYIILLDHRKVNGVICFRCEVQSGHSRCCRQKFKYSHEYCLSTTTITMRKVLQFGRVDLLNVLFKKIINWRKYKHFHLPLSLL